MAVGQAVESFASNLPSWDPDVKGCISAGAFIEIVVHLVKKPILDGKQSALPESSQSSDEFLTFLECDLNDVIRNGEKLLSSSGAEFDLDLTKMEFKERMIMQKKDIKKRLGFGSEFLDGAWPCLDNDADRLIMLLSFRC